MLLKLKAEGDESFRNAFQNSTQNDKMLDEALQKYKQAAGLALQIKKKLVDSFSPQKKHEHFTWVSQIQKQFIKALYKKKDYKEAEKQLEIYLKKVESFDDLVLPLLKIYHPILKSLKNDELMKKVILRIISLEKDPKELAYYQSLVQDNKVRDNPKINKAFYESLINADQEINREKKMAKTNLEMVFLGAQQKGN